MDATPNRLEALRTAKGWSREHLARLADVTLMTIYRLERQDNEPSLRVAQRIAHALGVSVDKVFPEPERVAG